MLESCRRRPKAGFTHYMPAASLYMPLQARGLPHVFGSPRRTTSRTMFSTDWNDARRETTFVSRHVFGCCASKTRVASTMTLSASVKQASSTKVQVVPAQLLVFAMNLWIAIESLERLHYVLLCAVERRSHRKLKTSFTCWDLDPKPQKHYHISQIGCLCTYEGRLCVSLSSRLLQAFETAKCPKA